MVWEPHIHFRNTNSYWLQGIYMKWMVTGRCKEQPHTNTLPKPTKFQKAVLVCLPTWGRNPFLSGSFFEVPGPCCMCWWLTSTVSLRNCQISKILAHHLQPNELEKNSLPSLKYLSTLIIILVMIGFWNWKIICKEINLIS